LSEGGFAAAVDDTSQEPDVPVVDTLPEGTTLPFVKRSNGSAVGYCQMTIEKFTQQVAQSIDPADIPGKMDALTQAEFNAIFYPDDSSDDSSE
jgi:hypothetical protein